MQGWGQRGGGESEKSPAPLEDSIKYIPLLPKKCSYPDRTHRDWPHNDGNGKKPSLKAQKDRAEERGGRGESEISPALLDCSK